MDIFIIALLISFIISLLVPGAWIVPVLLLAVHGIVARAQKVSK